MNADLEETLKELGEGYRPVVDRLRAAREVEPARGADTCPPRILPCRAWRRKALIAASLAVIVGMAGVLFNLRVTTPRGTLADAERADAAETAASFPRATAASPVRTLYELALSEDASALQEIIRTQAADGSWANDFLTRQNAAVLREADATSVAYRKAVRYLRTKGLVPLSGDELRDLALRAKRA